MNKARMNGDFTIPGESGHEALTLRLADAWGADTIRDSDGTTLSRELLESGREIYSTLCLIRSVNAWASHHRTMLQQNYLMSFPVEALGPHVSITLLDGFSKDQFVVNVDDDPKKWWQVFDRSTGAEIPAMEWELTTAESRAVTIKSAMPRHSYTVNFLVYRVWEEISMYNHVTNNWGDRERLLPVDPVHPEARAVLLAYLEKWLIEHPDTAIVRFTSLFYNFCWFWGDDPALRFVYSDWGSYDMTVSPRMMRLFKEKMGYSPSSEDFVNAGRYNSTHN
ncbi:D-galactosyl-beta-1-4-L-rhamnose phosphorylase, partial [bacterium]|nr:D-galactosyl-beta-1-4-L-rhamnose phosphorylase [bacterium]